MGSRKGRQRRRRKSTCQKRVAEEKKRAQEGNHVETTLCYCTTNLHKLVHQATQCDGVIASNYYNII